MKQHPQNVLETVSHYLLLRLAPSPDPAIITSWHHIL
jgi:hypothetical protein